MALAALGVAKHPRVAILDALDFERLLTLGRTLFAALEMFARPVVGAALAAVLATVAVVALAPAIPATAVAIPIPEIAVAVLEPLTRTIVAALVTGPFIPAIIARSLVPAPARFALGVAFARSLFNRLALRLPAFVLEVDVEAGGELVAAKDLRRRPLRLDGAQQPEIMLGVLQVVLAQHPVAGGGGVARQLLVLLEDRLGVAAHLYAFGPVGIEGPVCVLLRLAASAPAAPAALTLHALEISHYALTVCSSLS